MKILVMGGTHFLGRYIVEEGLKRGDEMTLFHRGKTNPDLFPDVEHVHGDRRVEDDLDQLNGRQFDAVIDTSAYFPKDVELLLARIAATIGHYTFISSVSVYTDLGTDGPDEESPVDELKEGMPLDHITHENYGPLKAAAERRAEELMPGRTLVIRPGLIVGPHDPSDRFTYWPWRLERGGEVLAPGDPDEDVQYIDVRDLASWIVAMVHGNETGLYNATGPAEPVSMQEFLKRCASAVGSDAELAWRGDQFLMEQEVGPFVEMPLWVPAPHNGMSRTDISRSLNMGATFRPLEETARDTLEWFRSVDRFEKGELRAGMKPEREEELLRQEEPADRTTPVEDSTES